MNKKGFTLVELLAVLVVLGIVVGITIPSIIGVLKNSKAKSEEVFVETIKDAMDIYLSGDEKSNLEFDNNCSNSSYSCEIIDFDQVISSSYKPINKASLVNPKNGVSCAGNLAETRVTIYRHDNNYVYYYQIDKHSFVDGNGNECLTDFESAYISNLVDPGKITCS